MEILALAALGALVVGFVLLPVFRTESAETAAVSGRSEEWERLAEQKERLLTALKDLEFEHTTGKLSDADYQRVQAEDLAEVARIIERMDALAAKTDRKKSSGPPPKKTPKPKEKDALERTCSSCGQSNPAGAKFCLRCGKPFQISVECPKCGTVLLAEARFCTDCGTEIRT